MSLKLKNIVKNYGSVEVLHDISIEIEKGDFLVLLGGSGCGKSTLLNCIAGLEETTGGVVEILGRDVTHVDPADRNVAMVFQSYALYPTMSVARNISFGLECARVPKAERKLAVDKVAKLLQIEPLLDRKPSQLSGGQRQRVAIGRALVRDPDIFLLDEPMSNLDAKLRNQMRFELRELHRSLGRTFVLVTHDQIEAMSMATKVAVLDQGYVQQFGTPYDVFHRPENRFVAEFIGVNKMNFLEGEIRTQDGAPRFVIGSHSAPLSGYDFITPPQDGQKATLGVRPENIYRQKERLEGHECLEAHLTVLRSELTGSDVQVWFDFEQQTIASRFRSSRTPDEGAEATLYMDMQNVSLFDPQSGKRL
ncbi:ABC transporter ATP-binding protein [Aliiroseovarius sp. 2305UL8-7]|uniref:ABC transporter ATP-binding protein n=1 Tax=Aliiroseovarius conchicola TaxID=3121637 RepID=UPI003526F47F